VSYQLLDASNNVPTYITYTEDPITKALTFTLTSSNAADLGSHNLRLIGTLSNYPGITVLTSPFVATITDPCLATTMTAASPPVDMAIVITDSSTQTVAGYTDSYTVNEIANGSVKNCGTITY